MIRLATKSPDDTREMAAQMASVARAGDVILLSGDLGAGKTTFTQGFGRGLGSTDQVTSPTFTLVQTYEGGRLVLHHLDLYRVEAVEEIVELGLAEMLDDPIKGRGAVSLIEWGEAAIPLLSGDYLEVILDMGEGDDDRAIALRAAGTSWTARLRSLTAVLDRWVRE